jgi:beta-lactamase superfamily II metal-dependent hydrolase
MKKQRLRRRGLQSSSGQEPNIQVAPHAEEVEVSLFGPSYGECIVIHAGRGEWFVVDSCTVPGTGQSRALAYLHSIGVDIAASVKVIVVTHWDDDHIRGISELIRRAINSKIVVSGAVFSEEFITLIKLRDNFDFGVSAGVAEFTKVINVLLDQNRELSFAYEQQTLWNRRDSGHETASLVALAPSSATVIDGHLSVAHLLHQQSELSLSLPETDRNHRSVVLWLKVGNAVALLGSDLMQVDDNSRGWSAILSSAVSREKGQVFKVPHHGSETSHNERIWRDLLISRPPAMIAPWRRGSNALPTYEDVTKIQTFTDRLYVTAVPQNKKKRRNSEVDEMIAAQTPKIRLLDEYPGHIRLRADPSEEIPRWSVALFGGAKLIENRMARAFPRRN